MDWWAEQTAIKEALRAAEKEAETAHSELVKYQDMLQQAAKHEEDAVRRELARATADYNKRLVEEKNLRGIAAKQAELAANMAEMEATITSSFMTEVGTRVLANSCLLYVMFPFCTSSFHIVRRSCEAPLKAHVAASCAGPQHGGLLYVAFPRAERPL